MAFKLPKEPIRNRKEFVTYLLATACGVGLALGLERAAEWWKEHSLVNEARHNLATEIGETKKRVVEWRAKTPAMLKNFSEVSDYTEEMLAKGTTNRTSLSLSFQRAHLNSAAWKAAEATGAAGHMSYEEAKRYAELYGVQQEFDRVQSVVLDELAPLMGFFGKGSDPTKNQPRGDMELLGRGVRTLATRLKTQESLGKAMEDLCEAAVYPPARN